MDIGLKAAIDHFGNGNRLADALGINRQAIYQWEKIPLERVIRIEELTGIPREELRPDFFLAAKHVRKTR
jgi:DNA-binding transcriptional regulator YdaS (Cro superfamily)